MLLVEEVNNKDFLHIYLMLCVINCQRQSIKIKNKQSIVLQFHIHTHKAVNLYD